MIPSILGVDIGKTGHASVLINGDPSPYHCPIPHCTLNRTSGEPIEVLDSNKLYSTLIAYPFELMIVELAIPMPGVGITTVATAFRNSGFLMAILQRIALERNIKLIGVDPKNWVVPMHLAFCKDPHGAANTKQKSKEVFQRLFPTATTGSDGFRDSVLLAWWYLWHTGNLL